MKRLALALVLALAALSASAAPARITVTKEARKNPTISFNGSAVDPALANEVRNFLAVCGWFDLEQGRGEYALSLRNDGGAVVAVTWSPLAIQKGLRLRLNCCHHIKKGGIGRDTPRHVCGRWLVYLGRKVQKLPSRKAVRQH